MCHDLHPSPRSDHVGTSCKEVPTSREVVTTLHVMLGGDIDKPSHDPTPIIVTSGRQSFLSHVNHDGTLDAPTMPRRPTTAPPARSGNALTPRTKHTHRRPAVMPANTSTALPPLFGRVWEMDRGRLKDLRQEEAQHAAAPTLQLDRDSPPTKTPAHE